MEVWVFNIVLGSRRELPSQIRSSGFPDRNEYGGAGYELYLSYLECKKFGLKDKFYAFNGQEATSKGKWIFIGNN